MQRVRTRYGVIGTWVCDLFIDSNRNPGFMQDAKFDRFIFNALI